MCSQSDSIRATLAESISIIIEANYPDSWDIVFPQLVEKMNVNDINVLLGAFETSHAICRQFRDVAADQEVYLLYI